MRIRAFFVSLSKLFYYHNFFELWIFEHYDLQEYNLNGKEVLKTLLAKKNLGFFLKM
jgi:hypothetical protein